MTFTSDTRHLTSLGTETSRLFLAPLRAIDSFLQSIILSHKLATEIENLSHASESKLLSMGLKRDEIPQHVARHFRAN